MFDIIMHHRIRSCDCTIHISQIHTRKLLNLLRPFDAYGNEPGHHHYNDVIMGVMASQITSLTINRWYRHRPKETSQLRVTGLCAGNSPVTGEFPVQMASYAENVSVWWRRHADSSGNGLSLAPQQTDAQTNVDLLSIEKLRTTFRVIQI